MIKMMKDQAYALQTNIEVYSREIKILPSVRKTIIGEGSDLRMRKVHFAYGGCGEDRGWLLSRGGGDRKELNMCCPEHLLKGCSCEFIYYQGVSLQRILFLDGGFVVCFALYILVHKHKRGFFFYFLGRIACLIVIIDCAPISKFRNGNSILEYLSSLYFIIYC